MAKSKSKSKKPEVESDAGSEEQARPGTSGTENMLMTNRRQASEQFAKASRAEKAYRTKKKAALARANYTQTKENFKEGFSHFKLAFKGLFSVIISFPYLIGEKQELRRQKTDAKKREKNLAMKKKLEEQLAKEEGENKEEA
ncbi:hypothetical protein F53441_2687 [Fusarium austroafricanum]|uniref:Uncharacterized protein n=1 Tax=Fusarium austroafricanum TaxID=2364996 RepID=A0A8H4KSE2_9HYPO|nr:hypothetical protein F53441_2687 [Fusarium austroafricanum]